MRAVATSRASRQGAIAKASDSAFGLQTHYRYLGPLGLDKALRCSLSVPMQVETLGIARSLGWKVHMRCAHGPREGMKRVRECVYRKQLDIDTLVCTGGPNFPLSRLDSRLMCPACCSRRVTVVFEPPSNCQVCSA